MESIEGQKQSTIPSIGKEYWTFYLSEKGFEQILKAVWKSDMIDMKRWKEGRIYSNRTQAENAADHYRI